MGMLDKIDVSKIVLDHLRTLRVYPGGKRSVSDYLLFGLVPLIVGLAFVTFFGPLTESISDIVVTSMSIFVALLLNLILLTYNITRHPPSSLSEKMNKMRERFLREIFSNIAFAVLVALIIIALVLCFRIMSGSIHPVAGLVLGFFTYFFGALFFLTILMLLKRVYVLLGKEQFTPSS